MVRLEEFMEIFRLKQAGYTISGMGRLTNRDRKTVRKVLNQGKSKIPAMKPGMVKQSKLKPFEKDILKLIKNSDMDFQYDSESPFLVESCD